MKLIACNSNLELAKAISSYVGIGLADATIRNFADREIFVKINENIRGEDIFIILNLELIFLFLFVFIKHLHKYAGAPKFIFRVLFQLEFQKSTSVLT